VTALFAKKDVGSTEKDRVSSGIEGTERTQQEKKRFKAHLEKKGGKT